MPDIQVSVSLVEGRPATTSLKIAECFGTQHKHVIRDIEALIAEIPEDFHKSNFGLMSRKVKIGNGAEREEPYYTVYFDGFMLLVMGYTGKKALAMELAYIGAFNAMRDKLAHGKMNELSGADPNATLTPDQQCTLQALVKARVETIPSATRSRGIYPQIWSRFNNHFRIAKYSQLPQPRLSEAIAYLVNMEIEAPKELPGRAALAQGVPPLAARGAEAMANLLKLRADLFTNSFAVQNAMEAALRDASADGLDLAQGNLVRSLGKSASAFFMSINHDLIAVEELFRAFMESEKMIYG